MGQNALSIDAGWIEQDLLPDERKRMSGSGHPPTVPGAHAPRRKIERRLAAILGADIRNYSGMMVLDEEDTHARVGSELQRVSREIEKSHGRIFSFAGDGLMAEFPSAVEALKCALRIQAEAGRLNAKLAPDARLRWRLGINVGEIVVQGGRSGGHAVNVAARLEQIAEPGGICLSDMVFEQVHRVLALEYRTLGPQRLKNMRDPVAAYAIAENACLAWKGVPALPRLADAAHRDIAVEYRPSLAVLPFRTLQPDQTDAYFAEGIVEDIIRALGGLKELLVVSRSSTAGLAQGPLDLRRIGHDLDVEYVLHGSVRRSEAELRIGVELCEARTGRVIWSDRFDGRTSDLFVFQDKIAVQVAASVAPHVREIELGRALRKHPENMTAYDLTLQALEFFYREDEESFSATQVLLHRATAHDPSYGPAYTHLAYLYVRKIGQGWSKDHKSDATEASEAARRAIALDRNDALALAIQGHTISYLFHDHAAAESYLERARQVGPSCARAWTCSSFTAGFRGDTETAVQFAEKGVRLSPLGWDAAITEHGLSQAYYNAGRFQEAADWARMSRAHAPQHLPNLRCLAASLVAIGEVGEARGAAAAVLRIDRGFNLTRFRERTPLAADVRDLFIERLRIAGMPD